MAFAIRINVRSANVLARAMSSEKRDVLHSWCVQAEWDAPTLTGGAGAYLWDAEGRRYLDVSSLAECVSLGYQHPAVVRAIREQAETLCFVTAAWGAEPRELAVGVLHRAFHNGLILLSCGASTVRFMPPLLVTRADVDEALSILEPSLAEALAGTPVVGQGRAGEALGDRACG
jgi:4-aminobutyrate aminotransferase-like enzyme